MDLNKLAAELHKVSKDNGFWDREQKPALGSSLMLIVSELCELLEEDRNGARDQVSEKIDCITRFEEELADTIIRCLDLAAAYKLDIDLAIKAKTTYNKARAYRHGKQY